MVGMALILAIVLLVSKFVLGINFSIMEHGSHISFGYHEVRGDSFWAMSFDSFSGSISAEGTFPENGKSQLLIHSGTENIPLELTIQCGDKEESYTLEDTSMDLTIHCGPGPFTMTVSGTEVLSGFFSAVWE